MGEGDTSYSQNGARRSKRNLETQLKHKGGVDIEAMLKKLMVSGTGEAIKKLDVVPVKGTLVVVPQLLVKQWIEELAKHAPTLDVIHYQSDTNTCAYRLARHDVVLVTFQTLAFEWGEEKYNSPLLHCQWCVAVHAGYSPANSVA